VRGQLVGGTQSPVQHGDPSMHARPMLPQRRRQRSYRKLIMLDSRSVLVLQRTGAAVRFRHAGVGESRNFRRVEWLRSFGVNVVDLDSEECVSLLASTSGESRVWNEDIGEE